MNLNKLFVFICLLFIYSTSSAQLTTIECLRTYLPPIYKIKNQMNSNLPADFISKVKESSEYKELIATYGDGQGMEIHIPLHNPKVENNSKLIKSVSTGESIQAVFVKKIISLLFPKAKLISEATEKENYFVLDIFDSSEAGRQVHHPLWGLQMSKIKLTNPGLAPLSRLDLRKKLGIADSSKVISVNNSLYNNISAVNKIISAIKYTNAQVLIISRAGLDDANKKMWLTQIKSNHPEFEVIRLTSLQKTLDDSKRYIVLNDTIGMMHAVYSISDLNITAGAVNLSEPILAKTQSLVFGPGTEYMHGYNQVIFQQALEVAKKSNAVEEINSLPELTQKAMFILNSNTSVEKKIVKPYNIQQSQNEKTPLQDFLSHLKEILDYQRLHRQTVEI